MKARSRPTATRPGVSLRDVRERQVFFKKAGDRWFVENRQQPEEKPADKDK